MRSIGIRVTDAEHAGKLTVLLEGRQASERVVKTDMVIDCNRFVFLKPKRWARFVIQVVAVRDDRVESVVAASHFEDDEHGILAAISRPRGIREELRHGRGACQKRRAFQRTSEEIATRKHTRLLLRAGFKPA